MTQINGTNEPMLNVWLLLHGQQLWCGVNGATFVVKECGQNESIFAIARHNVTVCLAAHETRWLSAFAALHPSCFTKSLRFLRLALLYK